MSGVNIVIVMGNLGRDVEVRYTQGGTAVANISLACNESKKEGDGWVDHVEWIDVVLWGKDAENAGKYLGKGSALHVHGRLQTRKWQDKDGGDRRTTEVVCHRMTFVGKKGEGQSAGGDANSNGNGNANKKPQAQTKTQTPAPAGDDGGFYDDDLPF